MIRIRFIRISLCSSFLFSFFDTAGYFSCRSTIFMMEAPETSGICNDVEDVYAVRYFVRRKFSVFLRNCCISKGIYVILRHISRAIHKEYSVAERYTAIHEEVYK